MADGLYISDAEYWIDDEGWNAKLTFIEETK